MTKFIIALLFLTHIPYFILPLHILQFYALIASPFAFILSSMLVFVNIGRDHRPNPKGHEANMIAVLSIAIFGVILFFFALTLGSGTNAMTLSFNVIARNLWQHGLIVVLGSYIRFKLIRKKEAVTIVSLTLVLAFVHITAQNMLFQQIFAAIAISAVASFFAMRGSFLSVLIISFTHTMSPYLMPILPNASPPLWSLMVSASVFITAMIYNSITNDKSRKAKQKEKRQIKYGGKPYFSYFLTGLIIVTMTAFFTGFFIIYPLAVLTNSMEGTFDRGSIVFVERVPQDEVLVKVGEGYIIHFASRTGVEYVHRVVGFTYDAVGNREYITKGDASPVEDHFPVSQGQVKGIVRAYMPWVGYPVIFFRGVMN